MNELTQCHECGMPIGTNDEYHPYTACVLYKHLQDRGAVLKNLAEVQDHGHQALQAKLDAVERLPDEWRKFPPPKDKKHDPLSYGYWNGKQKCADELEAITGLTND